MVFFWNFSSYVCRPNSGEKKLYPPSLHVNKHISRSWVRFLVIIKNAILQKSKESLFSPFFASTGPYRWFQENFCMYQMYVQSILIYWCRFHGAIPSWFICRPFWKVKKNPKKTFLYEFWISYVTLDSDFLQPNASGIWLYTSYCT